jgi:PEGA domain
MEATALVRPAAPQSRTGVWVALGVAFTAAVAGAVLFLTTPRTGRVTINVNDPRGQSIDKVEVFLDGKKWCDTTPCIIDPVASGSHEVKVLADGFEVPQARPINVESRKEAQLSFALAPNALRGGTGLKVSGYQTGVKLYVDDREIGPIPAEVRDLTAGNHRVRITGSERYATYEKSVSVNKDEMVDLGNIPLKVLKGKITVTLGTPGAKVFIVSGSDRRELPILPISVDIDTSKSWQLEAAKAGYADYRKPVSFDDGQAEKTFEVTLDTRSASASNTPATPAAVAPAPKPAPAAPAPKPAAADPTPAAPATGDSFLDINSIPVANVLLDGKPIGSTPKLHVSVPPGPHTVVFVNAEQGLKKSVQVNVNAGETGKAIARLKAE